MFIEGDNTPYTNNVTRQKISKEELCQGDKTLESIFDSHDTDHNGSLEGKELSKLMDKVIEMAESFGKEDTLEKDDFKYGRFDDKIFKKHEEKTVKTFISNLLKINHNKVSADFEEDIQKFNSENGYETIKNSNRIIPNKDNKNFQLIYNNNGKVALQTIGENAGRYFNSGYYEINYDIQDEKGNIRFKSGLYDPKGNYIGDGAVSYYKGNPPDTNIIRGYANAYGMIKTEQSPYIYGNKDGVKHHFENGRFVPIDNLIDSDKNGYLCQINRKMSQGYTSNFTQTIGFYKGIRYDNEAEYYIAKNKLNIKVEKNDNGNIKYVDKNNSNREYTYSNGQFSLTPKSIANDSKYYQVNGKLDRDIYQIDIGNCYMVSANQGISKYLRPLVPNDIITPENDPFELKDPYKNNFETATGYTVSFPGVDTNPLLGTKKHYSVSKEELQKAIDSMGKETSMGDPDEILLELALKQMRKDMISKLIKDNPYFKDKPDRLAKIHNKKIGNAKQYYLSSESIQRYLYGESIGEDLITAGSSESVLRLMLPKETKIEVVNISKEKKATEVIEEYRKQNYMILGTYEISENEGNHCVLYDNKAKKFISTHDPNTFDSRVSNAEDINNKIITITVVKIPEGNNKQN